MAQLKRQLPTFFIFCLLLTSCANFKNKKTSPQDGNSTLSETQNNNSNETENAEEVSESEPSTIEIPADHPLVQKWITYFTVKDRERFQRYLERGNSYKDVVQTILKENGLPMELYYLALIESGYATHARSRARAVGAWQFMKGTAKNYHLEVNSYIDERRDPIRSTEAASKYLGDLYRVFQNWELALAAYNCGEHRILRTVMKSQKRNFWELIENGNLPRETREYVPKFMAAILIGENPEYYGFNPPSLDNIYPSLESIEVPSPINIKKVAQLTDIPYESLKEVNPHLIRGMTTPYSSTYEIWVPQEHVEKIKLGLSQLSTIKERNLKHEEISSKYYVVRRGDNLFDIAKGHRVSVSYLKRLNNLRTSKIYPGQKLRISSKSYQRFADNDGSHTVKRGENLNIISSKYNIPLESIKEMNHLTSSTIFPGQKLKVTLNSETKKLFHLVKQGENLSTISEKYNVGLQKIKDLNNLEGNKIYSGQKLQVR